MPTLPVAVPLSGVSLESAALSLSNDPGFVCIDAREAGADTARHSIVASNPVSTFSIAGGFVTVDGHTTIEAPHVALLRFCARASSLKADPYLPFSGGLIGYIGFEGGRAMRGMEPARGYSRHSQCRLGIYTSAVVFDHREGTAFIVANGDTYSEASLAAEEIKQRLARLYCIRASESASPSGELRFTPSDAEFATVIEHARSLIRSDALTRQHLVRHAARPYSGLSPVDDLLSRPAPGHVRAIFTHEGAWHCVSSADTVLDIRDRFIRSTVRCAGDHAESRESFSHLCPVVSETKIGDAVYFKGRLRDELAVGDAIVGLVPSPTVTGQPYSKAMTFIHDNEDVHRGLYGGAFGVIDGCRLTFRTIHTVRTIADGAISATTGADVTPLIDAKKIGPALSQALSEMI